MSGGSEPFLRLKVLIWMLIRGSISNLKMFNNESSCIMLLDYYHGNAWEIPRTTLSSKKYSTITLTFHSLLAKFISNLFIVDFPESCLPALELDSSSIST